MKDYNGISICPVRNLEVGDVFASDHVGALFGGEIIDRVYDSYDLKTDEGRAYVQARGLQLPGEYSETRCYLLIVKQRSGEESKLDHVYLDWDWNVAVFFNSLKKTS